MPNPKYSGELALLIDVLAKGGKCHELTLNVGATPSNILTLPGKGIVQLPMIIQAKVIDKVFFDHGITKPILENIHGLIANPNAIFESDTQPGGIVVVTVKQKNGIEPIIVAIHPGKMLGRSAYNVIASIYSKPPGVIANWHTKGLFIK